MHVILSIYDSEGEVILDESDDSVATTYKNDIQLSSIDGASKEIKTLIRGLTKKSSMKSVYLNAFGFPELVNFNSTWNMLALNLSGIYEFDDMLNKLSTIQDRFPEVSQLIEILVGYRNSNSLDAMDMVNKFRQDFSRYETPIYEIVFDPAKLEYKIDETTRNNFKAIRRLFETNFLEKATRYTDISVGGELILNGTIFESIKFDDLKNLNSRIEFLDAIGIKLNSNALKDKKSSDIISEGRLKLLYNALQKLYNSPGVTITNPVAQLAKNESSHINALVGLEAKYNLLNPSASMQNAEGSTVYSLMLNNTYIIIAGYLNNTAKYKTYEDLVSEPHLRFLDYKNNPYIKSSIILNQLFDLDENSEHYGKRKLVNGEFTTLSVVNISGMNVDSDNYDAGHTNTRLFVGDKMIQDFNLLLKKAGGFKEFMRAGDKAMSLGIKFSRYTQEDASTSHLPIDPKYFKTNLFGGDSMMSIMLEHLRTEVERIQNYRERGIGKDLKGGDIGNFSLFSKIIPNERAQELLIKNGIDQYKPQITVWVNKFFVGQFNSYVDLLNKTNLKVPTYGKTGHGTYLLKEKPSWVSSEFSTKSNNIPFETLIRTYIVNSFILNIEQTKLFNGDGAFYASFTKRSAKDNGTGTTTTTDKFMLDKLNQNLNTNLQGKLNGVSNEVTTSVKTVVFKDMVVSSDKYIKNYTEFIKNTFDEEKAEKLIARIVTPYSKANEGDAQGYITLDFYRIFKILQGKWSNEHEVAYRKLILHDHYSNMTPTEEVSQETIDRIIHGNNLTETELAYFSPIKAQYAGPLVYDGLFAPVYHKFSLIPINPTSNKKFSTRTFKQKNDIK
jgi:hypothetical protein